VGQKAINTLLNAIESNHLASALLFTGPRGVGKQLALVFWLGKSISQVMMIPLKILLLMCLN
jgi:DNA polymerase III delta prime subunit